MKAGVWQPKKYLRKSNLENGLGLKEGFLPTNKAALIVRVGVAQLVD